MMGFDAWVVGVVTRALPPEETTVVWLVGVSTAVPVALLALPVLSKIILAGLLLPNSETLPLSWRGPIFA